MAKQKNGYVSLLLMGLIVIGLFFYGGWYLSNELADEGIDTVTPTLSSEGPTPTQNPEADERDTAGSEEDADDVGLVFADVQGIIAGSTNSFAAVLSDVEGGASSGNAYIATEENSLYHTVEATMPALEDGVAYEGWLIEPASGSFISTGVMSGSADGVFTLSFVSEGDTMEGYVNVVITRETVVDETPEEHVLEGNF